MNQERFLELLDGYGADLGRWPAAERNRALALLARSPEAAAALGRARALDDFIRIHDPLPPVGADEVDALTDGVMRRLGRQDQPTPSFWTRLKGALADITAARGFVPRYVIPTIAAAVLGGLVGSQLPAASKTNQVAPLDQLASLPRTSFSEF
jgi:hypothetical protein